MFRELISMVILIGATQVYAENDWVWGETSRESREREGRYFKGRGGRYGVFENDAFGGAHTSPRPTVPGLLSQPVYPVYNPGNQLYGGEDASTNAYYPEYYDEKREVLVGPNQQEINYQEFDRCLCTERFNCKTPGISYGQCDVGKRYCCYAVEKRGTLNSDAQKPIHTLENGILVGPGGPAGNVNSEESFGVRPSGGFGIRPGSWFGPRPNPLNAPLGPSIRPSFVPNRPLNQPNAPTGNVYSPQYGTLVGPGGPVRPLDIAINPSFIQRSADVARPKQ